MHRTIQRAAVRLLACTAFAFAVMSANVLHAAEAAKADLSAPRFGAWGIDLAGENRAVKPGDDFFSYVNGTAVDHMEIPPDRTRFGAFDALSRLSDERVRVILEDAGANPTSKIGIFYNSYIDEARIEKLGIGPLKPELARIRALADRSDVAAFMGDRNKLGGSLYGMYIGADDKDPDRYAVSLSTDGLGLPDRDYYLKPSFAAIKTQYQDYVTQMLTLIAWPDAKARAADIVAFETRMAEVSWERAELRNRDKTYNAVTATELKAQVPGFDIQRFLNASAVGGVDRFILSDNTAFPKKAAIFAATPMPVLRAWLAYRAVDNGAGVLPERFVRTRFAFRSKVLSGQPELAPRWRRAVEATNGVLGEAIGQEYVKRYFPADSKQQMLQLVGNLRAALGARIENLSWMSPETKRRALEKLAAFTVKIAYPDVWKDYSDLTVKADDLYGNVKRGRTFAWDYRLARLNKPVDRAEWAMTPQTVNAYYESTFNEIVFPAAILQPPFFDPKADAAVNYGGIGGVIGHEMSHGFDDQGRKSDGAGRLADWWTADDAAKFEAKAKQFGAQYDAMEILPGEHVNGKLTMGENIGDLGGLNVALDAYHASLKGQPAPVLDGFTGDQRFFLAQAQVWRTKTREEATRQRLHTDPHSPPEARVNGVVRNMDAWYEAFGAKPGDKLYLAPADRVRIW